jgi:hypothetical protein
LDRIGFGWDRIYRYVCESEREGWRERIRGRLKEELFLWIYLLVLVMRDEV